MLSGMNSSRTCRSGRPPVGGARTARAIAIAVAFVGAVLPAAALAESADAYALRLEALVGEYRSRNGVAPLAVDERLAALAREHSASMAAAGRMSHDGYRSRFQRSGYAMCVENVGWNYPTPERQMAGWKESPGHDHNLLDVRVAHMGVGVAGAYVTFIACR